MLDHGGAGVQTADEANPPRSGARRFESRGLVGVENHLSDHVGDGRLECVAQRQRELRQRAVVVFFGKLDPGLNLWRIDRQSGRRFALLKAEIVEAAGLRQGHGLARHRQGCVHAVGFEHGDADQRRVPPVNVSMLA